MAPKLVAVWVSGVTECLRGNSVFVSVYLTLTLTLTLAHTHTAIRDKPLRGSACPEIDGTGPLVACGRNHRKTTRFLLQLISVFCFQLSFFLTLTLYHTNTHKSLLLPNFASTHTATAASAAALLIIEFTPATENCCASSHFHLSAHTHTLADLCVCVRFALSDSPFLTRD